MSKKKTLPFFEAFKRDLTGFLCRGQASEVRMSGVDFNKTERDVNIGFEFSFKAA